MQKAKNRLLKAGAIVEFNSTAVFLMSLADSLKESDSQNLESVVDDIDVVIARLNNFAADFSRLLSV